MYFILRGVGGELKHIWSPGRRGGRQGAELSQKVRCGGPGGDGQAGGTGRVGRRRGAGARAAWAARVLSSPWWKSPCSAAPSVGLAGCPGSSVRSRPPRVVAHIEAAAVAAWKVPWPRERPSLPQQLSQSPSEPPGLVPDVVRLRETHLHAAGNLVSAVCCPGRLTQPDVKGACHQACRSGGRLAESPRQAPGAADVS